MARVRPDPRPPPEPLPRFLAPPVNLLEGLTQIDHFIEQILLDTGAATSDTSRFMWVFNPTGAGAWPLHAPAKVRFVALWVGAPTVVVSKSGRGAAASGEFISSGGVFGYIADNTSTWHPMGGSVEQGELFYVNNSSTGVVSMLVDVLPT